MDSEKVWPLPEDDRLTQLRRAVLDHRPVPSFYYYAGQLLICVGSIFSILRFHYGWSYEEVGWWWYVGYFGGELFGAALMITSCVKTWKSGRILDRKMKEFKEEKARRGYSGPQETSTSLLNEKDSLSATHDIVDYGSAHSFA